MAARKTETSENIPKRRRIVPTRAAGTPAFENPADELFAAAFANRIASGDVAPDESIADESEEKISEFPLEIGAQVQEIFGQPVSQNSVSQSTTNSSQSDGYLANQSTSQLDNQKDIYNKYPSRRLRKQKGLRLPAHKLEKWELWCFVNKIDFQDAVEAALDWLTSQPVSHILNDDLDENQETDDVIIFYQKWTGNQVRPKDREARKSVAKYAVEICQIGIIRAIVKAPSRINSFSYCVPVIEQAFEETQASGVSDLKGYLKYLIDTMLKTKR